MNESSSKKTSHHDDGEKYSMNPERVMVHGQNLQDLVTPEVSVFHATLTRLLR